MRKMSDLQVIGRREPVGEYHIRKAENGYIVRSQENGGARVVVFETWEGAIRYMLGGFSA